MALTLEEERPETHCEIYGHNIMWIRDTDDESPELAPGIYRCLWCDEDVEYVLLPE